MSSQTSQRPTWVEIDLDNLASNFHSVREFIGKDLRYLAVVKADAYGHGSVACARRLADEGIDWFGVALPEEGLELRNAGITTPILCLGSFWPGQEKMILENHLTPVIYQLDKAILIDREAADAGVIADFHVKIDTGMGRIGVRFDEVGAFATGLCQFRNLKLDGLMTHFASADDLGQNDFTDHQIARFYQSVEVFKTAGFQPSLVDLANSPGAIAHTNSRGNMVRLGGVLYGLGGDVLPSGIEKPELKPVLSLHSRISYLKKVPRGDSLGYGRTFSTKRDSVIATVPIGYSDGYSRSLSNKANVIVNGVLAAVTGRISMDWTILDVTGIPGVRVDDEVVFIGGEGDVRITAEDLAAQTNTISYEITCGIKRRVSRKFVTTR